MIVLQILGGLIIGAGLFFFSLYFYFWPQMLANPELRRDRNFTLLCVMALWVSVMIGSAIVKLMYASADRAYSLETINE